MRRSRSPVETSEISDSFELDLLLEEVEDDSERDPPEHIRFNISFYGIDYPVESIVQRMQRDDFFIPKFQRSYVWSQKQASRFIESLLYGLPVPGIFLYREAESGRHLIIDGQQRLKTLQYYYDGVFGEKKFRLIDVAPPWRGRSFAELEEGDKRRVNDSVIHATIFKQEEPRSDDQSIYYVFERINTGGIRLSGQEIRTCIYFGAFTSLLRELNDDPTWRSIYGPKSRRLKDEELILRFFAFYYERSKYGRPMTRFLNDFSATQRLMTGIRADEFRLLFHQTMELARTGLPARPFRPEQALNAAVFDSVMVGLAARLQQGPVTRPQELTRVYHALLQAPEYADAYRRATADEERVRTRMTSAVRAFSEVP